MYYSGINYEELWKLKVKDVLDEKGEAKGIIESGGKKMPLYISKTLKEEINRFFGSTLPLYDRESYVFVSQKGYHFTAQTLQDKIKNLLQSAKLPKVNFRTSFVKTLIDQGIEPHVVRKLARVKNLDMLIKTYYDEDPPDLLKVLNGIDL